MKETVTPDRLLRPRIDAHLRATIAANLLTLVHAPLGAGKTTALRTALDGRSDLAWMDAKPWHRAAFAEPLVAAIRAVRPGFGRVTLGGVAAGATAEHLAATFTGELTHLDDPLLLLIDDAHVFAEDARFAAFLSRVLRDPPGQLRIVLCGRALPELPLGDLFAQRRAARVDGEIFVFDHAEIDALAQALGRPLDAERVRELVTITSGWAAGIVLALADPAYSGGATRAVTAAYLSEELLAALPADLVTFLEQTSVFETLDLRVLQGDPAFAGAAQRIAALRRGGALLSELPADRFRVHPVLRQLASDRLRARSGAGAAHAAAAAAYAAIGELRAALFHADAANDPATAARFLRAHADAAGATGDDDGLRELAAAIDPDGPDGDVRAYVDALLAKAHGGLEARELFVRAAGAANHAGAAALAFNARAQILEHDLAHLRTGTADAVADVVERAAGLGLAQVARATMLRGWAYAVGHDFPAALATIAPLADRGDTIARFNTAILLAYVQTSLGAVEAAEATLDALIRLLENSDQVVLQALALIWLARLSLTWGNTNLAADAAFAAERLASAMDLHANEAGLYAALTDVASHLGDIEATVRFAERAQRRATFAWYAADIDRVRAFATIGLARAAFLGRENATARDLAQRAATLPNVPSAQRAVLLAEGAVYTLLCEPGAAGAAISHAHDAIASAVAIDAADAVAVATAADIMAFLAAANGESPAKRDAGGSPFAALIDQRRGLVTLELAGVAVGNARRGRGSTAAFDTARTALTRDGPRFEVRLVSAYASRFIAERPPVPAAPAQTLDLTPREIEILALLVDGLTNKEIAQRIVVSPRTVETHVERVLDKLDVRSRSRAIAKAIRLGIVRLDEASI